MNILMNALRTRRVDLWIRLSVAAIVTTVPVVAWADPPAQQPVDAMLSTLPDRIAALPPDRFLAVAPDGSSPTVPPAMWRGLSDTGADTCFATTPLVVVPGPAGSPSSVTTTGDTSAATGPDCLAGLTLWWESFEIDPCAQVTIDFCGSSPALSPSLTVLVQQCDTSSCGNNVASDFSSRSACPGGGADTNIVLTFNELPAGRYYYPIFRDSVGGAPGPYQMTVTAEEGSCFGACCDTATAECVDDVQEADCTGPDFIFSSNTACCELTCVTAGGEFDASGVALLGRVALNEFPQAPTWANDVWGFVTPSGREYAVIGLESGTGFVEITDPANPVVIDEIPGTQSIWRDMAYYNGYIYSVNDDAGGMHVIDVTGIDAGIVTLVKVVTDDGFSRAHNIFINESSGYAYLVGSNLAGGGLLVADLSDPANPSFVGGWNQTYVHDTYVTTYDDGPFAGHEIAFNSCSGAGFYIVDVTNKASMSTLASLTYPTLNIAHQGWLSPDRRYYLMGDEGDETNFLVPTTTYVVDVQDLNNPFMLTDFTNGGCAIDHNLTIQGSTVLEANYTTGLRAFDMTDVNNISEVAYFDTRPEDNAVGFYGAWGVFAGYPSGVVVVSDIQRGLFILDVGGCSGGPLDLTTDPSDRDRDRYLTVRPGVSSEARALRVTPTSAPGFPAAVGVPLWAGPPRDYPEEDTSQPGRTFVGAGLACTPHFRDWSTIDVLHIFGAELVPSGSYTVESVLAACAGALDDPASYSPPLVLATGTWGDVAPLFDGDDPKAPQPDFNDIAAVVKKFSGNPTAPIKALAQLQPNTAIPSRSVDFKDIAAAVSAYVGNPYSYSGPCSCPSSVPCNTIACTIDSTCGAGFCLDGFCTDSCGRCFLP